MVTLSEGFALDFAVLNYAKYIKKVISSIFTARTFLNLQYAERRLKMYQRKDCRRGRSTFTLGRGALSFTVIVIVLWNLRRCQISSDVVGPGMAAMALPSLHGVGLLHCECRIITLCQLYVQLIVLVCPDHASRSKGTANCVSSSHAGIFDSVMPSGAIVIPAYTSASKPSAGISTRQTFLDSRPSQCYICQCPG
jgi:hypothetical protein